MARGINKVILVGNLGADPEVKYMPNGGAVANVSLATTDSWKDKESGEQRERTEWHRLVFFNRLAEIAGEYLRKGSQIYVEGSLRTRKWQSQDGQDRYTTEIVVGDLKMLGGLGDDAPAYQRGSQRGQQQGQNAGQNSGHGRKNTPPQGAQQQMDDFDDDIPF